MDYKFVLPPKASGLPFTELETITQEPDMRPRPGDIVILNKYPGEQWRVLYSDPADNSANANVTYFLENVKLLNNLAGGDVTNFGQYYLNAKMTSDDSRIRTSNL